MRTELLMIFGFLSVTAAGCVAPGLDQNEAPVGTLVDAPVADATRGPDQYWLVWLHGSETVAGPNVACSRIPDHDIDPAARTLSYNPDTYAIRPSSTRAVLALDHLRPEGCVAAYGLVPDPSAPVTRAIGGYGPLTITIRDDGSLRVGDQTVPLGKALTFTYDQPDPETGVRSRGSFRVENLGAWDRSDLRAQG